MHPENPSKPLLPIMVSYTHSSASLLVQALAFLLANMMFISILLFIIGFLYHSPRQFTLYFLIPYYSLNEVKHM